ncbi:hypothetical protein G9C85_01605 [Halorubellus sp. JP-L1]|uniref:PKD domain-containing protein n=1 Tax=Halorubellus sp. JP-L1 TaxID=2715753 RepID=UPI0014098C50|nr:PKD domain-containing protein [Halorubellus sp. JP-L1]NHN40332.1 hypothetical protein [Halorubellus sp. JP-L1]
MRRPLAALALLAVVALATAGVAASASPTNAAATESTGATDENFSVTVQTPQTVASNVTMNFSVDVTGADGNVTAEWTFEGSEKKAGTTVQHVFDDGGNATVAVVVTDESGETVTRELVVDVVEYGDDDESSSNPLENVATIALFGALLGGVPLVLLLFVVPKAMEVITDAL